MGLAERIGRLFTPVEDARGAYGVAGGLPRGMVGPWGTVGGGYPIEFDHWNRYNGYPGTAKTFVQDAAKHARTMPVAELYASQPHLQTVVAFRARNVAQLPLHLYEIRDDQHKRVHDPLASLWTRPNSWQTGFELIRDTVTTLDLYGEAFWSVLPSADTPAGWAIQQVPAEWVTPDGGTLARPARWKVAANGREVLVPAQNMVRFTSAAPNVFGPVSPVAALREILAEQIAAWVFRGNSWSRGAAVSAYVYRPKDAPDWTTNGGYERFTESWHEFQNGGARAGEAPVLEDGMELRRVGYSAREDEWAETAALSLRTVCSVYHVPPAMVGAEGTASYASAREFRSMLYTETLGPIIRELEQRINQFVLPVVAPNRPDLAVKFNIDAKLAGSFEEQASVLSTATGAPWMTVNEARALRNLPPLEDGDSLVVPLNVTQGGQASPQDGGKPSVAVENAIEAGTQGTETEAETEAS